MKIEIRHINENNIFAMLPVKINRCSLTGSEKQVAWANDLLDEVVKKIALNNNCHAHRLNKNAAYIDFNAAEQQAALRDFTKKNTEKI